MNKSRAYIKNLSMDDRESIASSVGISSEYLYQIGISFRTPSRKVALKLEFVTLGKVTAADFDSEARQKLIAAR